MFDTRETFILSIMIIACGVFLMGLSLYFFRRIKTYDDYNVAGRSTSTFPLICTLIGTAVGGSTLLGFVSKGYTFGMGQLWLPVGMTFAGIALYFFIGKIHAEGERLNMVTLADFLVSRFGEGVRVPTLISILCAYAAITGMQFVAVATVLKLVFGLALPVGILLTWALLTAKTWLGGLMAVIWSDAILGTLQTLGIFFLLVTVYYASGSWEFISAAPMPEGNPDFLSLTGISGHELAVYMLTIGAYQFVRQDLWQRFWAARSLKAARTGYGVAIVFTLLVGGAVVLIGAFAKLGLDIAVANPDLSFYAIIKATLPLPLMVSMVVVLLATIISCADSFFIAGASSIANDIIKPRMKGRDDAFMLRMSRHSVVAMSLISLGLALYAPRLLDIWILGSAMLVCGVLVPTVVALCRRTPDPRGGVIMMWGGLATAVLWQVLGHPFGLHPVMIGLPVSLALMPLALRKPSLSLSTESAAR